MPNFLVTTTVAAGPTPLSAVPLNCRKANLIACKGLDGPTASPNTGTVKVGRSPTASQQPIEMASGDERSYEAVAGARMNLQTIFFTVANNGDGLVVDYE